MRIKTLRSAEAAAFGRIAMCNHDARSGEARHSIEIDCGNGTPGTAIETFDGTPGANR
jgi:hypothetical protein